jgi:hypothetical protein
MESATGNSVRYANGNSGDASFIMVYSKGCYSSGCSRSDYWRRKDAA